MNRRTVLKNLALAVPTAWLPGVVAGQNWSPLAPTDSAVAAARRFQPTWASLPVRRVELLGHTGGSLAFERTTQGLRVTLPTPAPAAGLAYAFKILS